MATHNDPSKIDYLNAPNRGFVDSTTPLHITGAVRPNNFYDEVALGLRSGVSKWNKFGYRSDIDSDDGEHVIWERDETTFTPLTSAETFDITYTNTGDGATTTGARALTFYYINSDGEEAVSLHTLGSSGSDTTSFSGYGINRIAVSSTGTANSNNNNILVQATTSGTTQATIPAGQSVTQQMIFFVAANRIANVKWIMLHANKTSGEASRKVTFKGYVYNRNVDTCFEIFRLSVDVSVENTVSLPSEMGFSLSSTDVLYFVASTDTNNTDVSARFDVVTYENT